MKKVNGGVSFIGNFRPLILVGVLASLLAHGVFQPTGKAA